MQQSGLFDQLEASPDGFQRRFEIAPCFESFRTAARLALNEELAPDQVWWVEREIVNVESSWESTPTANSAAKVPGEFFQLARFAACHQSPDRWSLLYQVLWRLTHGEPHLLALKGDPLVAKLHRYDTAVHRDLHKMKAFVRFKRTQQQDLEHYVAWFEPEHPIIRLAAPFFRKRFTNMHWSILTPYGCAHWQPGSELIYSEGIHEIVRAEDDLDELWQVYYRNIFNPARVKTDAMRAEMPQKYWKHLPEAELIPAMLLAADETVNSMLNKESSPGDLRCGERPASYSAALGQAMDAPGSSGQARLTAALHGCQDCSLWQAATQVVPGEGPVDASIMLVGEQPGDLEDLNGRPFIGPAGQLLDETLASLGIERQRLYLTNAVKHFRFRPVGKRRLHERPREGEVQACRHWLQREIDLVNPELIICVGATATRSVLGPQARLNELAGRTLPWQGRQVGVVTHPAAVLRSGQPAAMRQKFSQELMAVLTSEKTAVPKD